MTQKLSQFLSYIFHPVFLPGLLVILLKIFIPLPLFYTFLSNKLFIALWLFIVGYTAVIPVSFIFLLKRLGMISDIELSHKQDRPKVYLFASGFFIALAYFLFNRGSMFMPTSIIILAMAVNILGLFVISFFDKISVHASGLAGFLGIILALYTLYKEANLVPVFLVTLVIFGLVSSARLNLGSHNLRQIILGTIWGGLSGFIIVFYFIRIF